MLVFSRIRVAACCLHRLDERHRSTLQLVGLGEHVKGHLATVVKNRCRRKDAPDDEMTFPGTSVDVEFCILNCGPADADFDYSAVDDAGPRMWLGHFGDQIAIYKLVGGEPRFLFAATTHARRWGKSCSRSARA